MQDYTPLGSTATTTVKDGILNHEKNINALRSTYSGTAFPTESLVAGLKCYRTDLGKTYTYNGEAWDDSVNTSSLTVSGETSVPTPATENNSKTIANTEFVHGVVNNLVNGAPTALDTLQELASALGNDPNFATTVLNQIGEKESKTDAQIEHKRLQDAIPTKVSQLSNDSGYQKTAEIPVVSQTQNGYMGKDDKAKLDGIEEGATNVTDYVQSVTESNGKVTVTKGSGESTTFNAGLNILARNKAYAVGDIAYSPNLPSYRYLECTRAGTTGATEPDMSNASVAIVNDGTAQFGVKTVCAKEYVDAVNATVNEMKEKYIFRFETFTKAQITRINDNAGAIAVSSPVPQGYERMAVITYSSGIAATLLPDLTQTADKISGSLVLWMHNAFDTETANTIWNNLVNLGVFTIFVKKG